VYRFLLRGAVFVCCLSLLLFARSASTKWSFGGENADDLVALVIAGIEQNDSQLKTIRAKYEFVTERPGLSERKEPATHEEKDRAGRVVRRVIDTTPAYMRTSRTCTLRGPDFRITSHDEPGSEAVVQTRSDGVWTHYYVRQKRAWIRLAHQIPKAVPADPRRMGLLDPTRSVTEVLKECETETAAQIERSGRRLIQIRLVHDEGQWVVFDFDPALSFLPTRIAYVDSEGLVHIETEISYQEVLERAWFPKEAATRFFNVKAGANGDSREVRVIATMTVDPEVVVNEPVEDDTFVLTFPQGTEVQDLRDVDAASSPAVP